MDVKNVIAQVAAENHIHLDFGNENLTLKDTGVDSLAMMDLIFKIEDHLGVRLDDNVLTKIRTLGDLIAAFSAAVAKK